MRNKCLPLLLLLLLNSCGGETSNSTSCPVSSGDSIISGDITFVNIKLDSSAITNIQLEPSLVTNIQSTPSLGTTVVVSKTCIQGVPSNIRYDALSGDSSFSFTLKYNAKDVDPNVYYNVIAYFSQGNLSVMGQSPVFGLMGNDVFISILHPNVITD